MKKQLKKNLFKKGLTFYLVFLAVIFIGIIVMLWTSLARYQEGLDAKQQEVDYERDLQRAPQLAFCQYVEGLSADDWYGLWCECHPLMLDNEADVRAYIGDHITNADIAYYKAANYTSEAPVYLVRSGDGFEATFTMSGADVDWRVSSVSINALGDGADKAMAARGITVYCNEVSLGQDMGEAIGSLAPEAYVDSLVNPLEIMSYDVGGLLSAPSFSGKATIDSVSVELDLNGVMMLAVEDTGSYKTKADAFVKSLLNYYKMGKNSVSENMAAAVSHVASGSDAASVIRSSLDGVLWANYTNADYTTWTSSVYKIADNALAVDVYYYDANQLTDGQTKEDITEVYRVYFIDLGQGYRIYSFSLQ